MTTGGGVAWAPGARVMESSHGVGTVIAHSVIRLATYRVLWHLPLFLVLAVAGVAVAWLVTARRSSGGRRP